MNKKVNKQIDKNKLSNSNKKYKLQDPDLNHLELNSKIIQKYKHKKILEFKIWK